jgi:hypothetical protein
MNKRVRPEPGKSCYSDMTSIGPYTLPNMMNASTQPGGSVTKNSKKLHCLPCPGEPIRRAGLIQKIIFRKNNIVLKAIHLTLPAILLSQLPWNPRDATLLSKK